MPTMRAVKTSKYLKSCNKIPIHIDPSPESDGTGYPVSSGFVIGWCAAFDPFFLTSDRGFTNVQNFVQIFDFTDSPATLTSNV